MSIDINRASHCFGLICHVLRRQEQTVMKLVVDSETDKVLGASMCGPDAPEIMQVTFHDYNV